MTPPLTIPGNGHVADHSRTAGRGARLTRLMKAARPWILTASIAANVFLLALAVAPMLHHHHAQPSFEGLAKHLASRLPPADAERFLGVLERERPWYATARREIDVSRVALARSIAAEPYDDAAVQVRMLDFQAHWQEMSTRFNESLRMAISTLSPEGRARLAEAINNPPPPPGP